MKPNFSKEKRLIMSIFSIMILINIKRIIDEPDQDDVSPDTNDSPDSSSPNLPPHASMGSDR